ncbi:tail fiber protein [Legionella geestiana]|uniref:Tail fiber protein n=1 Tax=Legionella geestiana TaxID=45065 RepID=A0A0W0TSA5_9GAMM|nr:hypothetical protein [Legionella geestiana]KTC98315.1 tail fiber protein [Legionella geestiana]QBS11962.1 hypothetical protein E4T54_03905 [Legionella geestiana]QDQ40425.1 DUF1566 domain-containing protein [Legionella geestiana]STX53325.1 tail fiber protein [Legionella geestiana]
MNFSKIFSTSLLAVASALALPHKAFAETGVIHQVGDRAEGGIVFYVNRLGTHGLVAAASDQRTDITLSKADYSTGLFCSNPELFDENAELYLDWRLPTRNELKRLYNARYLVGNFVEKKSVAYVSGNMNMDSGIWVKRFEDGREQYKSPHYLPKEIKTFNIRCIRSF